MSPITTAIWEIGTPVAPGQRALSDGPGWRWIFLIYVPVGILLIALAARFLARDAREARAREFDVAGAVTATGGLMLLVYALSRTTETGWDSPTTLGLFAAAGSLLLVLLGIEAKSRSPLVPATPRTTRKLVRVHVDDAATEPSRSQ